MKNIILQHWTGDMNELGNRSSANIANYAREIGAEYKLIIGDQFRPNLSTPWPPIQKLCMLDEEFDEYDMIVMLDMDMFVRKGLKQNVFTDVEGVGLHGRVQESLLLRQKKAGHYTDPSAPWWGGAIYRMDRKLRQLLRTQLDEDEIDFFCTRQRGGDEGLLHRLASLADIDPNGVYFPDNKWCYCSFLPGIETASLIHIRTKITPTGPKRDKIENYKELVKKGIIE